MQNTSAIASAVRTILRDDDNAAAHLSTGTRLTAVRSALRNLEASIPARDPAAFEPPNIDAFGYATVLGYPNQIDPLGVLTMADPVRDTIQIGVRVAAICRQRGLKVVKVPACDHIKQRYAKVTEVNAYPTHVLDEVFSA